MLLQLAGGCQSPAAPADASPPLSSSPTTQPYRAKSPDRVVLDCPSIPLLNYSRQEIDAEGNVRFPGLPPLPAGGKTVDEIADLVRAAAAEAGHPRPRISVQLSARSRFYYVYGVGCGTQEKYPLTGTQTVLSALSAAGFDQGAWPRVVRLCRSTPNGERTIQINLRQMFELKDYSHNYRLEDGDVIEVTRTPFMKVADDRVPDLAPATSLTGNTVVPAHIPSTERSEE